MNVMNIVGNRDLSIFRAVICLFYRIPREFFHIHSCSHKFCFSFWSSTSHIFYKIGRIELPWDAKFVLDPATHLCFWFCWELGIIVVDICLVRTWYHPWCGTWVFEVWSSIEGCEFVLSKESKLDNHDISRLWPRKMRICFVVESCCCDVWVRKYRAVVLCHFEGLVGGRPKTCSEHRYEILLCILPKIKCVMNPSISPVSVSSHFSIHFLCYDICFICIKFYFLNFYASQNILYK